MVHKDHRGMMASKEMMEHKVLSGLRVLRGRMVLRVGKDSKAWKVQQVKPVHPEVHKE
jgi:hypothetical protein